eukprot:32971-Eustigmatos_ZCMA.PRE.1
MDDNTRPAILHIQSQRCIDWKPAYKQWMMAATVAVGHAVASSRSHCIFYRGRACVHVVSPYLVCSTACHGGKRTCRIILEASV